MSLFGIVGFSVKIWFEAERTSWPRPKECKDCGVVAPDPEAPGNLPGMVDEALARGRAFCQTSPLHISECAIGCSLVCHPTGKGHLAVLDQEALELLEAFHEPVTLAEVVERQTRWSFSLLATVAAHFLRLGLISFADDPSTSVFSDPPTTVSAWLHVSNACNLRCSYCYVSKTTEHMSEETAFRAVDAVFRSALRRKARALVLRYAGGEASLVMPRVCAIHDYATKLAEKHGMGLHALLLSNGVMLTRRMIDALKARQMGLMISLDGIGAAHDSQRPFAAGKGSFSFVERTLQRLQANELTPHISVTVSQRNLAGLPELISYLLERDLPFSLNYYRENECSTHLRDLQLADRQTIEAMRNAFALIEKRLPRHNLLDTLLDKADLENAHQQTCGVGHNYLAIDQFGGVAKCHADIRSTVTTIEADDPLLVLQQDQTGLQNVPVDEKEGCRSCQWRYWCTGGCPLLTWKATGRTDVKSPHCSIYQALFPDVLRLEALRLLTYETPYVGLPRDRELPATC